MVYDAIENRDVMFTTFISMWKQLCTV